MHERSIARHLLDVVEQQAAKAAAKGVKKIHLVLGEQSHIAEESLKLHFDQIAAERNSIARGAKFSITWQPMRFRCVPCSIDYERHDHQFRCPSCGASGQLVGRGDELLVESIEVID